MADMSKASSALRFIVFASILLYIKVPWLCLSLHSTNRFAKHGCTVLIIPAFQLARHQTHYSFQVSEREQGSRMNCLLPAQNLKSKVYDFGSIW